MTAFPLLVAVMGPTGSGKSDLAIHLAQSLDGEVISCDSLQIFKFFDVGTAKLPEQEWQGVPHHLIDWADPDQTVTAGDFSRVSREIARGIAARGKVPIVAGGTGFYLRAMLDGLSPAPQRNVDLRARLTRREQTRPGVLHRLLRWMDARSAQRIHPHDIPKLIRAIEIAAGGGAPASDQPAAQRLEGFDIRAIGLFPSRAELYERLDHRCEQILNGGLIEECESILARGYAASVKPFESIGYAQAMQVLSGALTREQALADMQMQTRRYAKRQMTWFRRERELKMLEGFGSEPRIRAAALEWLLAGR